MHMLLRIIFNLRFFNFSRKLTIASVAAILSCSQPEEPYRHTAELIKYLSSDMNLELTDTIQYKFLLVPLKSCSPCVSETLEMAHVNRFDSTLFVFLLGENEKDDLHLREITTKLNYDNVFWDLDGRYLYHDLGLVGPTIVSIDKGRSNYFIRLKVENISQVKTYFNWK